MRPCSCLCVCHRDDAGCNGLLMNHMQRITGMCVDCNRDCVERMPAEKLPTQPSLWDNAYAAA